MKLFLKCSHETAFQLPPLFQIRFFSFFDKKIYQERPKISFQIKSAEGWCVEDEIEHQIRQEVNALKAHKYSLHWVKSTHENYWQLYLKHAPTLLDGILSFKQKMPITAEKLTIDEGSFIRTVQQLFYDEIISEEKADYYHRVFGIHLDKTMLNLFKH